MAVISQGARRVLLSAAAILGSMIVVGCVVGSLYPGDWRPAKATVRSSHIKSVNISSGNNQWALVVDTTYEAEGRLYEASEVVFRDRDRSVTEAQTSSWPAGRTLTLYFDAKNPNSVSLVPDGGREATIVVAVLLTPLVVLIAGFIVLLVRRLRTKTMATP